MISYDAYRVFYYAGRFQSFTKAASALMTSQPAVSHTIGLLEHELGCKLFVRSNRGIRFTPEGERLYAYVSEGCKMLDQGEQALRAALLLHSGAVHIGTTETALHCCLFDALERFHTNHPGIKLKLTNQSTSQAVEAVQRGQVDLAVAPTPVNCPDTVVAEPLCSFQDIWVAGPRYAHLRGKHMTLSQLQQYPLIVLAHGTATRAFLEELFAVHGLPLEPDMELASADLVLPMVRHGLGIGFLPRPLQGSEQETADLFALIFQEEIPQRQVCLLYDRLHTQSVASQALIVFLLTQE